MPAGPSHRTRHAAPRPPRRPAGSLGLGLADASAAGCKVTALTLAACAFASVALVVHMLALLLGCIIICNTQDYLKFNPDTFSAMFMLPLFIEHDTIESKPVFRDTISLGFCINAHSSVFNAFKKLFDSDFSHALTAVDVINDDGYGNVYIRGARRRSPHARSRRRLPHTRSPQTGSRRRSPRTRLRLEPRGLSEHIGCHK